MKMFVEEMVGSEAFKAMRLTRPPPVGPLNWGGGLLVLQYRPRTPLGLTIRSIVRCTFSYYGVSLSMLGLYCIVHFDSLETLLGFGWVSAWPTLGERRHYYSLLALAVVA